MKDHERFEFNEYREEVVVLIILFKFSFGLHILYFVIFYYVLLAVSKIINLHNI